MVRRSIVRQLVTQLGVMLVAFVQRSNLKALFFDLFALSFVKNPGGAMTSRRALLRIGALSAAAGLFRHGPAHAAAPPALALAPVADGLFVSAGRHELINPANSGHIANVSFVVGRDCVAVITHTSS